MNPTSPSRIPATLIPGDGIGPEVVEATVQVLDALGSPFDWDVQQAGMAGVASAGDPLPAATLASIRERRLALKAADHAGRHGLPLIQCAPARGIRAVRQRPPGQHHRARPLREYRPGADPGKPGRLLCRARVLHPAGQRSARGGRLHRHEYARRQRAHCPLRVRVRGPAWPQENHRGPQGQHPQGAHRPVPRGLQACRQGVRGPGRGGRHDRGRLRHAARAQSLALRHAVVHQPVRRHPVRPAGRPGRRPGHGAGLELRQPPSSRRCTARRPTSRARAWPIRFR